MVKIDQRGAIDQTLKTRMSTTGSLHHVVSCSACHGFSVCVWVCADDGGLLGLEVGFQSVIRCTLFTPSQLRLGLGLSAGVCVFTLVKTEQR